jgi:hypothetical protein
MTDDDFGHFFWLFNTEKTTAWSDEENSKPSFSFTLDERSLQRDGPEEAGTG